MTTLLMEVWDGLFMLWYGYKFREEKSLFLLDKPS